MATRQAGPFARLIFAAIGVGMIFFAIHWGRKEYAVMKTWPKADAVAVSSQVAERQSKNGTEYMPRVRLKYSVGGKEYVREAEYSGSVGSHTTAQRLVDEFEPGSHHLVPYNPADPNEVHVGAGWNFDTFGGPAILLFMGVVFTLIGTAFLLKLIVWSGLLAYQRLKS